MIIHEGNTKEMNVNQIHSDLLKILTQKHGTTYWVSNVMPLATKLSKFNGVLGRLLHPKTCKVGIVREIKRPAITWPLFLPPAYF